MSKSKPSGGGGGGGGGQRQLSAGQAQRALKVALAHRSDFKQSSVAALFELAGDTGQEIERSFVHQETLSEKLRNSLGDGQSDPLECARHFNAVFKPALGIRECIEFDERGGNLLTICTIIISVMRKLRKSPQIRILAAMKRFFRAIRVMSRLIRQQNEIRRMLVLDVVKWWESRESAFRQKLEVDMLSPLFRFHHEIVEIVEMRNSYSIPPEVKFGIVKTLYYRHRARASRAYSRWRDELMEILQPLETLKASGQRNLSGRYLEPTESKVRELRRRLFHYAGTAPVAPPFNADSITMDALMEVKAELQRIKAVEHRKNLLVEFQAAVEATKTKRRISYVAMEAKRLEDFKAREAARLAQQAEFDEIQRQRQEIMSPLGKRQKRLSSAAVSIMTSENLSSAGAPPSLRMTVAGGDGGTSVSEFDQRSLSNAATQAFRPLGITDGARSAATFLVNVTPTLGGRRMSTSVTSAVSSDTDSVGTARDRQDDSYRSRRSSTSVQVVMRRGTFRSEPLSFSGVDTVFLESGSLAEFSAAASLKRTGGVLRRTSTLSKLRSVNSFSSLRRESLASQLVADPLAFLEKFGTKQYELTLREREKKFLEELEAKEIDEERKLVEKLVFRRKTTPTPQLVPFFASPSPAAGDDDDDAKGDDRASGTDNDAASAEVRTLRGDDETLRIHLPVESRVRLRAALPPPPAPASPMEFCSTKTPPPVVVSKLQSQPRFSVCPSPAAHRHRSGVLLAPISNTVVSVLTQSIDPLRNAEHRVQWTQVVAPLKRSSPQRHNEVTPAAEAQHPGGDNASAARAISPLSAKRDRAAALTPPVTRRKSPTGGDGRRSPYQQRASSPGRAAAHTPTRGALVAPTQPSSPGMLYVEALVSQGALDLSGRVDRSPAAAELHAHPNSPEAPHLQRDALEEARIRRRTADVGPARHQQPSKGMTPAVRDDAQSGATTLLLRSPAVTKGTSRAASTPPGMAAQSRASFLGRTNAGAALQYRQQLGGMMTLGVDF